MLETIQNDTRDMELVEVEEIKILVLCPFPRGALEKDCEEDSLVRTVFGVAAVNFASALGKVLVRI